MQVIENLKVKEKLYTEKLENGLTVMIIPKKDVQKKYVIWGTKYGSNDSEFIVPGETEATKVPNGIAHFLEHKMFEQENGTDSLFALTSMGVSANAYTTNDQTAYLFEGIENFYEALTELMHTVQHPYFTDENVEKEKGIIAQEIKMYEDTPEWRVYLNAIKAMYKYHPVRIDTAGTVESISKITKETLYKCYNTFYNPSNMILVICGDFEPEELLEEVKKRLIETPANGEIKRIYPQEPEEINQEKIEEQMQVSTPLYTIGIKVGKLQEEVKAGLAIEILLDLLVGPSSQMYQKLYSEGTVFGEFNYSYETSRDYSHIIIGGTSKDPQKVYQEFKKRVAELKEKGINKEDFERLRKKLYGNLIKEFEDVSHIARMFLSDAINDINSFDYLEEIESVNLEYATQILNQIFNEEKMVISIIKN